ncbi:SIS domain-containing protein [Curtobacterium sp. MCSS17_015]|uniref:SIS domain-containing protein n=1 Tax=Curtobacterium sp. MCSS17_015 TaxID=2175666 RepID=UPI000DA74A1E|nr:SIS domain-containing protein [Curtobacterium sp. MCSS17_015]WIB25729.1 SIS domain-containing protein [Curtobacterium sp. MCSS17_015]
MVVEHNPTLLERLTDARGSLRASERKVAELVAENPTFVVDATMAAVAEAAGVSEPTVMRFCTGLGYSGFQQFKIVLAQSLALGIPATLSGIGRDDTVPDIATKVFDHTISSLDRARRLLDPDRVEQAVEAILGASSMNLVGLGASALIALDAEQKAPLFGIPCSAQPDPHQQYMAAMMARPGTITLVISNIGHTQSVIEVARTARANGSTVIAVSGDETPVLAHADIPLVVKTIEDTDTFTPTASRIAGLVLIDLLATAVALRRGEQHLEQLSLMKEGLARFRRTGE